MLDYYLPHIAFTVTDIQKTKDFYQSLGFITKKYMYSEEKQRYFLLLEGFGLEMEVFHFDDQEDKSLIENLKEVGIKHIALPVENLEIKKTEFISKGITIAKDISVSSLGVRHFNITDPSGLSIEFFERKSDGK